MPERKPAAPRNPSLIPVSEDWASQIKPRPGLYSTRQVHHWLAAGLGTSVWIAQQHTQTIGVMDSTRALMAKRGVRLSTFYGLDVDLPARGSLRVVDGRLVES